MRARQPEKGKRATRSRYERSGAARARGLTVEASVVSARRCRQQRELRSGWHARESRSWRVVSVFMAISLVSGTGVAGDIQEGESTVDATAGDVVVGSRQSEEAKDLVSLLHYIDGGPQPQSGERHDSQK